MYDREPVFFLHGQLIYRARMPLCLSVELVVEKHLQRHSLGQLRGELREAALQVMQEKLD
jgi:hypothetical protein